MPPPPSIRAVQCLPRLILPVACAGLAVLLAFGPAASQVADPTTPADSVAPRDTATAALEDTLQTVHTLARLDSLEAEAAGDPLALGLISARRHDLTGDLRHAQRAFNLLYEVAREDTRNGWAFYGLGRVVAARPAVLFERPGLLDDLLPPRRIAGVLGLEPQSRAQQALLQALLVDPTIDEAALLISDMAVVSMDPGELEIAAAALDWVTGQTQASPEVWLALSRVRSLMTDVDAANAAALVALNRGADASLALLSAASALLTRRISEERGAHAYLEGTRVLSREGARRYYRDVEQILDRSEQREWAALVPEERGRWLRHYWEMRAGLAGTTVARMLGDHYRTVSAADRFYGGEYGEPSPVDELLGTGDHFPNVVDPGFVRPLDYVYDFYQFRAPDGLTSVTAALAIPADQLRPILGDSQVVYGVGLSMILVDTINEAVTRVDTTLYFTSPRLVDAESWLRAYIDLDIEPRERIVYRLSARDAFSPGTGALYGGPMPLRAFGGTAVELSDLVLTRADSGSWRRGDMTFPLTPAQSFGADETITVFYEIYNLPPDQPYRTEIRVVPEARGLVDRFADLVNPGSRSLRIAFDATAPSAPGPVQEVRTLRSGMRPDRYVIEVRVTDPRTGELAVTSRTMMLVEED